MSTLKQQLKSDVVVHMKAGNKTALTTLRNVLGEIETKEKSGKTPVLLDDAQVTSLLQKEVVKRRETAKIYADAGESERASNELAEAEVIEAYLPKPLEAHQVQTLVDNAVQHATADGRELTMRDMGLIMGAVTPLVAGRFDGKAVSDMVRARLSK